MYQETVPTPVVVAGSIIVTILIFLALCFRVVGVGQVGVLTSFGHISGEQQSGALLKAPWPFQTLSTFDIKTQKDQADAAAASSDLQDVKATLVTNYHIDPNKVGELFRTVGTDYKIRLIDPAIQESVKATTANYPISELITKRQEVKVATLKVLRERLAPRGVLVEDISFVNMDFSPEFTQAIEQKQVAQQRAEQASYDVIKAQKQGEAEVAAAQGRAQAQALTQASLTPEILTQHAIDHWNGVLPTTLAGSGTVFNIPLK